MSEKEIRQIEKFLEMIDEVMGKNCGNCGRECKHKHKEFDTENVKLFIDKVINATKFDEIEDIDFIFDVLSMNLSNEFLVRNEYKENENSISEIKQYKFDNYDVSLIFEKCDSDSYESIYVLHDDDIFDYKYECIELIECKEKTKKAITICKKIS